MIDTRKRSRRIAAFVAAMAGFILAGCGDRSSIDPGNPAQVAAGKRVYDAQCASCHGANLEGQTNWRERRGDGKLPAPPHDASGHTWHHADEDLFGLVKHGMAPYAGPGYESDMPAYAGRLSDDEIRAVLAFIKSRWPAHIRDKQAQISAAKEGAK